MGNGMLNKQHENHLAKEKSLYLLQHAHNPVDWYPWGEEALEKARRENKPILLSIGYSACHWCHVMAHESFEDEETAALMNVLFVNIKVDREERPDLDKIYQTAHQLLTNRGGGWPLTAFLMPDQHIPYFVGTYFPKEPRYQMPAFKDVLRYMATTYRDHKKEIEQQNQSLLNALNQLNQIRSDAKIAISDAPLQQARQEIVAQFDPIYGGFGNAPKFPQVKNLELLLHYWIISEKQDKAALTMVEQTLTKMAQGGIYDQIGGGFFRYSVDAQWEIPHFEKMLYDNGLLLSLYAQAYASDAHPLYKRVMRETGEWVMREMQSNQGGYFATLDADSEGHEGKFYVWSPSEVQSLLSAEEYAFIKKHFNLSEAANFEAQWHLHVTQTLNEKEEGEWEVIRNKLLKARENRVRPGRDEKIITAWNGLMVKGMVLAGVQLQRQDFIDSAQRALDFLVTHPPSAFLDDYVFLLDAVLTFLQARWHTDYLKFAQELADNIIKHFADENQGGFFFVADNHEKLIYRPKTLSDEAVPASNAIAALVLQRLGFLLGEKRYLDAAENTLKMFWPILQKYPSFHASTLLALAEYLQPPEIVIIRGDPQEMESWKSKCVREYYSPHRLCFAIDKSVKNLPPALAEKAPSDTIIAYLCQGQTCLPPITDLRDLHLGKSN